MLPITTSVMALARDANPEIAPSSPRMGMSCIGLSNCYGSSFKDPSKSTTISFSSLSLSISNRDGCMILHNVIKFLMISGTIDISTTTSSVLSSSQVITQPSMIFSPSRASLCILYH